MSPDRGATERLRVRVAAEALSGLFPGPRQHEDDVTPCLDDLPDAVPWQRRGSRAAREHGTRGREQQSPCRLRGIVRDGDRGAEVTAIGTDDAVRRLDDRDARGGEIALQLEELLQCVKHLLLDLDVLGERRL